MAGVGHMQRICKDAFSVAGAVQETCSSWRSRRFCVTGAALRMTWHHFSWQAQHFRQVEWKNRKTHWYEAVVGSLAELFRF